MLIDRVLACIAENPDIAARALRRKFRGADAKAWRLCLQQLRQSGEVQLSGKSRYRFEGAAPKVGNAEPITQDWVAGRTVRDAGSGFITPPSTDRLMSGR